MTTYRLTVAFLFLWLCLPGCTSRAARSMSLVVLPDAQNLDRRVNPDGSIVYEYELAVRYPAAEVIAALQARYSGMGWRALAEGVTGGALSAADGWMRREGADGRVDEWHAQWQDPSGRVVWYVLSYDVELSATGVVTRSPTLQVRGIDLAPETVETLRSLPNERVRPTPQ